MAATKKLTVVGLQVIRFIRNLTIVEWLVIAAVAFILGTFVVYEIRTHFAKQKGAADALRDVRKQWRRNRTRFDLADPEVPVFAAVARNWNDPGISRLYEALRVGVVEAGGVLFERAARE